MTLLDTASAMALVVGLVQAVVITADIVRHPQQMMPIMNIVWPLVGSYFPVVGIRAYFVMGRSTESTSHHAPQKPLWQGVFVSTTHCSSGCSLGDMIGAPMTFWLGLTLFGSALLADYVVEFCLAYVFGIAFQYFGMGFRRPDHPGAVLKGAIKADTLSLVGFEVGMFGWMALVTRVFFVTNVPHPTSILFWFMMQLATMIGFGTSYPVNWLLVKKGIKHAM